MRILLLEAVPDEAATIQTALKSSGIDAPETTWVERLPQALARLGEGAFDLILVDLALPGGRGVDVVARLHAEAPRTPIVVLADIQNEPLALEALRRGAQDHLLKAQIRLDHSILGRALRYAVERQRREEELDRRRREADVLGGVTRSINSTLDLGQVLAHVVEWARDLCRAEIGMIALVDPGARCAHVRHVAGPGAEAWTDRRLADGDPEWTAVENGRPVRVEETRGGQRRRVAVPMVSADGIEGVLCAERAGTASFSDHDELLLMRLADAAAMAIRNARLYAHEQSARAAAEVSEARLRLLFASAPVAMWVLDATSLEFLAVNEAAARQYGYDEAEFLRMRLADLRATGETEAFGAPQVERHRTKDGRLIDVEMTTHPFVFDGRPAVFALGQDVTVRRRAEEMMRENENRLRQVERLETAARLAASVAGELANVVTVIEGHVALARDAGGENARLAKHLETVHAAALRVTGLNARLLAFGQRQTLHPEPLDLGAMVGELVPALRRLVGDHVRVSFDAAPAAERVVVDRAKAEQVLVNLVVNARDAMPEGGQLMIDVMPAALDDRFAARHAGVAPGRYVLLAVSDTGHGMSAEVRARVFEPRFTTRDEEAGERGWGLATVHGIVQQSGGEIFVYSEPHRGTTVKVYLPTAPDAGRAPAPRVASLRGDETVLIVEDETQVRQLAVEVLEAYGYRVLEARYPEEALANGERHAARIDLLLTDVVMPGIAGPEVARRLLAHRPGLKILYMSGYPDTVLGHQGVSVEAGTLLEKPFTADELASRVRARLDAGDRAPSRSD